MLFGRRNGLDIGFSNKSLTFNKNAVIIGNSGSGKTYGYVLSNLLQADHSAIVIDPYANMYHKYRNKFEAMGVKTYCVSTIKEMDGELPIEELATRPTYLFIAPSCCTPSEETNEHIGYTVAKIWKMLYDFASDKPLPVPVHFYLDEFPNIRIPNFFKFLAVDRKYGVGCSIIVQSIDQLKTMYKDNCEWELALVNSDTLLFLYCSSPDELKLIWKITNIPSEETKRLFKEGKAIVAVRSCPPTFCDKLNPEDYGLNA